MSATPAPPASAPAADGSSSAAGRAGAVSVAVVDRVVDWARGLEPTAWADLGPAGRAGELASRARAVAPLLADADIEHAVRRALARLSGLGPLEPLLADAAVTEVMVNGGGTVWIERHGALLDTGLVLDEPLVLHLIERVVSPLGLRVDRASPVVDARLADGSRINAVIRPVAVDGPCLTIRRFGVRAIDLRSFASPEVAALLERIVRARANVLVSGGTGSGKTTLLNALASSIPAGERVVTVEDTAELRLRAGHVVRLEARPPNAEGIGSLRVRDLVRNALRMRPDRIVVGEVRGDEALDMLQAMNTGHEGSLSTCHANSAPDALRRIESMILMGADDVPLAAIREQIRASIDVVVHVARGPGGARRVAEVHEVRPEPDGAVTTVLCEGDAVRRLPARPSRAPRAHPSTPVPPAP